MDLSVVSKTFCPLLLAALDDHSAAVRTSAVSSFRSLLRSDWQTLFLLDSCVAEEISSPDWRHLEAILRLSCSKNGEKNANVRSLSCKAIGNICTIFIGNDRRENCDVGCPFIDDFVISFSQTICRKMEIAIKDESASVRSMVSFIRCSCTLVIITTRHFSLFVLNFSVLSPGTFRNWKPCFGIEGALQ